MEVLQVNILSIIREKCSPAWGLNVFGDHIIVNIMEKEDDFRPAYARVKKEITQCMKAHFPERNADILFEVRNGSWNCSFKIGKTLIEP